MFSSCRASISNGETLKRCNLEIRYRINMKESRSLIYYQNRNKIENNKLAKARKMRKPPCTLGFFGPGKALIQKSLGLKYLY